MAQWTRIQDVLYEALQRPQLERERFVRSACADDRDLGQEVLELLEAGDQNLPRIDEPDAEALIRGLDSVTAEMAASTLVRVLRDHRHGSFLPGSMLGGRYRIVSLAGRGGMGEVYRADDLKLGVTVALKFLPQELQADPSRLERFLGEVRIARKISHSNVCRVFDVGEFEGHHFFSMEYVYGEDLRSLLKRIGRVPREKAGQIALQLCSGLSAAHELGP